MSKLHIWSQCQRNDSARWACTFYYKTMKRYKRINCTEESYNNHMLYLRQGDAKTREMEGQQKADSWHRKCKQHGMWCCCKQVKVSENTESSLLTSYISFSEYHSSIGRKLEKWDQGIFISLSLMVCKSPEKMEPAASIEQDVEKYVYGLSSMTRMVYSIKSFSIQSSYSMTLSMSKGMRSSLGDVHIGNQ